MTGIGERMSSLRVSTRKIINEKDSLAGRLFDVAIITSIILSIIFLVLAMDPGMARWKTYLIRIEWFFIIFFTVEYLIRIWTSHSYRDYLWSLFGIIDLLAIVPAYLSLIPGIELEFLLLLRVLRILKLTHLFKYCSEIGALRSAVVIVLTLSASGFAWHLLRTPEKTTIIFSTGSKGGKYYQMAEKIKQALESEHDDLLLELKASNGSNENIRNLEDNKAHIAWIQNDCTSGKEIFSIASVYPEILHLITRSELNIDNLQGLKNKRVNLGTIDSGTKQVVEEVLKFSKITISTENTFFLSPSKAIESLENKELDAAFFLSGLGSDVVTSGLLNPELKLTAIQLSETESDPSRQAQKFANGINVHYPYLKANVIPQMAYEGRPNTPSPSLSVAAILACNADLDSEIVNRLTKALFTRRAQLSSEEVLFSNLDESTATVGLHYPLHEGAEDFYLRREPGFLVAHAEVMGFILTVILLLWSGGGWVKTWLSQRRKNRIDIYYLELCGVMTELNKSRSETELEKIESQLFDIRRRATAELVHEQLDGNISFVIYQNMLNGCGITLDRIKQQHKKL